MVLILAMTPVESPSDVKVPVNGEHPAADSGIADTATIEDFVDVHGPGCMRAEYKDTKGYVSQAPALSRAFWQSLYGTEYPTLMTKAILQPSLI